MSLKILKIKDVSYIYLYIYLYIKIHIKTERPVYVDMQSDPILILEIPPIIIIIIIIIYNN